MTFGTNPIPFLRSRMAWILTAWLATHGAFAPDRAAADPVDHPNLARGRSTIGPVIELGDLDESVDPFTGQLSLRLPLSLTYPVSEALEYDLALRYDSGIFDRHVAGPGQAVDRPAPTLAGLGWDLSFGRLLAPADPDNGTGRWLLVDHDGTRRPFYDTLHADAPDDDPNGIAFYTRDGSYLRLLDISATRKKIERGDHSFWVFEAVADGWRLWRIGDRHGNRVFFDYPDADTIVVSDSHGREQILELEADPVRPGAHRLARVSLSAFGGERADYHLSYTVASLPASCLGGPASVEVSLLTEIVFPEGERHRFTYGDGSTCAAAGRLASRTDPLGGQISWSYGVWAFGDPSAASLLPVHLMSRPGVTARWSTDADGMEVGRHTFERRLRSVCPAGGCGHALPASAVAETTWTTPVGGRFGYHHSIYAGAQPLGEFRASSYGLPIAADSQLATVLNGGSPGSLSTEIADCSADDGGTLRCVDWRREYRRFDQDGECSPADGSCGQVQRREVGRHTLFLDDLDGAGQPRASSQWSVDFDGLGHFRTRYEVDPRADYGRLTYDVGYHPEAGTYPGSFQTPSVARPWILGVYDVERRSTADGQIEEARLCFDTIRGTLLRRRTVAAPPAVTPHDVVTTYEYHQGNTVAERSYGADLQPLGTDGLCELALPAVAQRTIYRRWSQGALEAESVAAYDQPALPRLERSIDAATGLVAALHDVAGHETRFTYDHSGRQVHRVPSDPREASQEIVRTLRADGMDVTTRRIGAGGDLLTATLDRFDSLGRHIETRRRQAGGTWSVQTFRHDALGRRIAETFAHRLGDAAAEIHFGGFDALGRHHLVRMPDGAVTTLDYRGDRAVVQSTVEAVAHQGSGLVLRPRRVTIEHDRWGGQRRRTTIAFGADDVETTTVIERRVDAFGRWLGTLRDGVAEGWQRRFDGRGFLVEETLAGGVPETVTFGRFDTQGNPGEVSSGRGTRALHYDALGRPLSVVNAADPGTVYERWIYGAIDDPEPRRRGRLVLTERSHFESELGADLFPFASGTARIRQRFEYQGPSGRRSAQTLEIVDGSSVVADFRQVAHYGPLGERLRDDAATCSTCPGGMVLPSWEIDRTFDGEQVVGIESTRNGVGRPLLSDVTYHPGGRVHRLEFGNGVTEIHQLDATGIDRPGAYEASGLRLGTWESGAAVYDPAGNMARLGTRFLVPQLGSPVPDAAAPEEPIPACAFVRDRLGELVGLGAEGCDVPTTSRVFADIDGQPVLTVSHQGQGRALDLVFRDFDRRPVRRVQLLQNWLGDWGSVRVDRVEDTAYWGGQTLAHFTHRPGAAPGVTYVHAGGRLSTDALGARVEPQSTVPPEAVSSAQIDERSADSTIIKNGAAVGALPAIEPVAFSCRAGTSRNLDRCSWGPPYRPDLTFTPTDADRRYCTVACNACCDALSLPTNARLLEFMWSDLPCHAGVAAFVVYFRNILSVLGLLRPFDFDVLEFIDDAILLCQYETWDQALGDLITTCPDDCQSFMTYDGFNTSPGILRPDFPDLGSTPDSSSPELECEERPNHDPVTDQFTGGWRTWCRFGDEWLPTTIDSDAGTPCVKDGKRGVWVEIGRGLFGIPQLVCVTDEVVVPGDDPIHGAGGTSGNRDLDGDGWPDGAPGLPNTGPPGWRPEDGICSAVNLFPAGAPPWLSCGGGGVRPPLDFPLY